MRGGEGGEADRWDGIRRKIGEGGKKKKKKRLLQGERKKETGPRAHAPRPLPG